MFSFAFQPDPRSLVQNQVTKRLFLLLIVGNRDEVPVKLFDTRDEAVAFAKANPPLPYYADDANCPEYKNAHNAYHADVGLVMGVRVTEFIDGVPLADLEANEPSFWWSPITEEDKLKNPCPWTVPEGWYVDHSEKGDGCVHAEAHGC